MNTKVMIITTTYNSQYHVSDLIESCAEQSYRAFELIIADDGSTDFTNQVIEDYAKEYDWITHLKLSHGERGIARFRAIQKSRESKFKYLFIVDSDMKLEKNLLSEAVEKLEKNERIGALVIKEIPVSTHSNVMTRIKTFERMVINNAYKVDKHSIEAARFWREDDYLLSGGINPKQISFEETQPTIRYIDKGGKIERLTTSGLIHDEKKVTFRNLMAKKKYHFKMMPRTMVSEDKGIFKALSRWYFFRPVLYQPNNLWLYIKHPLLTAGMLAMYMALTFVGVRELAKEFALASYDNAAAND